MAAGARVCGKRRERHQNLAPHDFPYEFCVWHGLWQVQEAPAQLRQTRLLVHRSAASSPCSGAWLHVADRGWHRFRFLKNSLFGDRVANEQRQDRYIQQYNTDSFR